MKKHIGVMEKKSGMEKIGNVQKRTKTKRSKQKRWKLYNAPYVEKRTYTVQYVLRDSQRAKSFCVCMSTQGPTDTITTYDAEKRDEATRSMRI